MNRIHSTALVLSVFVLVASAGTIIISLAFTYPQPVTETRSKEFYDTSFWDISDALVEPLQVEAISEVIGEVDTSLGPVDMNVSRFSYHSETLDGIDIRINSYVIQRTDLSTEVPAVLLLHGYGSNVQEFLPMMIEIAAQRYIVMGIDSPGSGESTNYPQLNPYTFFDVSEGPESAHLYHSVWSAVRAVTFIETYLPVNATIVGGASMGGMETAILSAIDNRVDGSISMISGGNLYESLMEGSLINSLIDPDYTIGSEEMDLLQRWFDPIAYYRSLTKPLFMIFGTNDPFFVASSFMQTIEEISAPLTLSIRPNYGHVVDTGWSDLIVRWLNTTFRGVASFSEITNVTSKSLLTISGWTLRVQARTTSPTSLMVCWRNGNPGATWSSTPMSYVNGEYVADITPILIGKVTYFVYSVDDGEILMSSKLMVGHSGSFFLFITALISAIAVYQLSRITSWVICRENIIREVPIFAGIIMVALGFILPFYGIDGRVEISLLNFIEIQGMTMGLSGWFLAVALFIFYYIIASATVRHKLEFKVIVAVWFPMLVLVTIAHIFFAGVFAISGGLSTIYTGVGAYLLVFAIPVMLILESTTKDTTMEEEIISRVLEDLDV